MKYRFIGESPFGLINGVEYPFDFICHGFTVQELSRLYPREWELVEENPLHKDTDLGYFAGIAMQGVLSNPKTATQITEQFGVNVTFEQSNELVIKTSIALAKELIKQLNEENK